MTYDLDPGRTDYLATAIELGNNSLGNQSPTELVAEIAKAIRDCPNGARIVVEDMTGNRSELVERVSEVIYDYLDERFPDGAFPGGVQVFADDHLDAEFKHEAGCDELAERIVAAIPSAGGVEERLRETLEGIHRLAERCTGISGTRSLHAAMHAISQAASAALGGGQ